MADQVNPAQRPPAVTPAPGRTTSVAELAARREATKPPEVREKEWRRHRQAHGHMVVIRSHFKSIFLIPMAILSLIAGIGLEFNASDHAIRTWGLVWTLGFVFYMNLFIFEWNRAATIILLLAIGIIVTGGLAVSGPNFDFFGAIWRFFKNLNLGFAKQSYFFFGIFFGICAAISWIKTRINYVVMEHNEIQVYRNALFGDRERLSMLNPRVEIRVTDMIEYFHPFYRAGMIIIHAPNKTLVLENVLHIRKVERITDKLGSTLAVSVDNNP